MGLSLLKMQQSARWAVLRRSSFVYNIKRGEGSNGKVTDPDKIISLKILD